MSNYEFGRTPLAKARLDANETGMFAGRTIIGRDSRIDGGVYVGSGEREAIVIDFSKDTELFELYERTKGLIENNHEQDVYSVLRHVYDEVAAALITDAEAVSTLVRARGFQNDKKVTLGVFIEAGVGLCRHQNLACAAIIERLIDEDILRGTVSIDRNSSDEGGHAWCRYTDPSGEVIILDVTQEYFGNIYGEHHWDYRRPEESDPYASTAI